MSSFSIDEADEEDEFAQLRQTKTPGHTGRDGKITKLGAVPLKTPSEGTKSERA